MNLNATILGQTIAFVLFVWFCMQYVWPPIMDAIEMRQKEIFESLASADRAKKNLDIARANADEYLKNAKAKAQLIIENANKYNAQIIDKAKAETERERSKIMEKARVEIVDESNRAREELRKQVAMLAIICAEKIIDHSMTQTINSEILDKLVADL